jgi:PAS domain S-box-containing protein
MTLTKVPIPPNRAARLPATADGMRSIGEKRLRLALEAAGLGAWELDPRLHRSTWSLRAREILGLPALQEVTPELLVACVHPDDRSRFAASWRNADATPGDHACEFRVGELEGPVRWVLLRSRTTSGNGHADQSGHRVGTVLDVTPRKTAEETLRSSQSLLAEAQRIARLGAFEWQLPSREAVWTDEVFRIVGREPGSFQPRIESMLDHVHPDDRGELTRLVERCIRTGEPFSWRFRVIRPDGSSRVALRQGHMVRGPTGIPLRIVGTVQDVTRESHEAERQHETTRRELRTQGLVSLAVLSGGIAHDFNNILCSLLGSLDLALEALPAASPARVDLERAQAAGVRAADLTARMLTYSGGGALAAEPLDMNDLVDSLAGHLRQSVPASAAIQFDLDGALPWIDADVSQLRQLVLDLVLNAAEALPPTGGTIRVQTRRTVVDTAFQTGAFELTQGSLGPAVCLEVSDDGHGMDAETRARMFEPFFSTRFTGRGLGLASAIGIVRAHGGGIRVSSAPGRGTTVEVVFPFAGPRHTRAFPDLRAVPSLGPARRQPSAAPAPLEGDGRDTHHRPV